MTSGATQGRTRLRVGCFACWVAAAVAGVGSTAHATETVPTPPPPPPGLSLVPAPPADEPIPALVVERYAEDFGISESEAARRLELQGEALELDAELRERLAEAYGGVHFDNDAGRIVVSATTVAAVEEALAAADEQGLSDDDVRVRQIEVSLDELEGIQAKVDDDLRNDIAEALVSTAIDASAAAVRVKVSAGAPATTKARVAVAAASDHVEDDTVSPEELEVSPDACGWPNCSRPLRGGVKIFDSPSSSAGYCTGAFIGYTSFEWVLFTAGHCAATTTWWAREHPTAQFPKIGGHIGWYYDIRGDAGTIRTTGTQCGWCPDVTTPIIAAWGLSETWPIQNRAWSVQGLYVCRFGATTSIGCGTVLRRNVTITYRDGTTLAGMIETDACSAPGDSGGPYIWSYYAIGIHSGSNGCASPPRTYAEEVLDAEARLGAWVAT